MKDKKVGYIQLSATYNSMPHAEQCEIKKKPQIILK